MLLGTGLVFLAMGIIGSAGTVAAANADLKLLFGVVDHYPLVVFIGALLTVSLQSSTASIGLSIGLAQSGLLPGTTIVPWVLGANLGITLTMMQTGWGSIEGRRSLLTFLIESPVIDDSREPDSYLDPLLLQAPSLALNQAAREELRLLDEIKLMLRTVWVMIWGKNVRLISKVEDHQRRAKGTQEELKDYLSQISEAPPIRLI